MEINSPETGANRFVDLGRKFADAIDSGLAVQILSPLYDRPTDKLFAELHNLLSSFNLDEKFVSSLVAEIAGYLSRGHTLYLWNVNAFIIGTGVDTGAFVITCMSPIIYDSERDASAADALTEFRRIIRQRGWTLCTNE